MQTFIKIHPQDNVLVALQNISAGTALVISDALTITALSDIPSGHKMAITDIPADSEIIKYGSTRNMCSNCQIDIKNLLKK